MPPVTPSTTRVGMGCGDGTVGSLFIAGSAVRLMTRGAGRSLHSLMPWPPRFAAIGASGTASGSRLKGNNLGNSGWPLAERPRERLLGLGAATLTDAELLAVLLRTGVAGR